ncbi:Signal-transduction histidine kinase senX3 [compost metagenome]
MGIALQNLVTNAVDHSPAGGRVTVTLQCEGQALLVSVDDEGPGIAVADQQRVFERFYSKGTDSGAGLGLSIVSTIMTRLGGSVQLRNQVPHGLRATLRLPVGP